MSDYQYRNLKQAVTEKASPLRGHLEATFPNVALLRRDFKKRSGTLLVEPGGAAAGTVGTAFDLMVRFLLDPGQEPEEPMRGSFRISIGSTALLADVPTAIQQVTELAQTAAADGNTELLARACWPLALASEVFRSGTLWPGSPLTQLVEDENISPDTLMELATDDALRQLRELHEVAGERLFPHLPQSVNLAPRFEASKLVPADADLIAGGCLLELKVVAGTKNARTGVRPDDLKKENLFQVIAYTLFDTVDEYKIDSFGVYSARYGNLTTWPLVEGLGILAGRPVDVAAERTAVWNLLSDD